MLKQVLIIVCLIIGSLILTGYEVNLINQAKQEKKIDVYVSSQTLSAGTQIEEDDIVSMQIDESLMSENLVTDKKALLGLTIKVDLPKKTLLNLSFFTERDHFEPSPEHSITTLKLNAEEAMCWRLEKGEQVSLIYVDLNFEGLILGEITIKGIFNENMVECHDMNKNDIIETSILPSFVVIEGSSSVINKVVALRGNGRFELVKIHK